MILEYDTMAGQLAVEACEIEAITLAGEADVQLRTRSGFTASLVCEFDVAVARWRKAMTECE